ncbi:25839_t:CDS:1, partial [Racocetra persica]
YSHSHDMQELRDGLITHDDIYTIVYNMIKTSAYFDKDETYSLEMWYNKIISMDG